MGKKKLVIVGVISLAALVFVWFVFFNSDLRDDIAEEYYKNSFEDCIEEMESISYALKEGFDSKLFCSGYLKCASINVANLIEDEDLVEMHDRMKKENPFDLMNEYLGMGTDKHQLMNYKLETCDMRASGFK